MGGFLLTPESIPMLAKLLLAIIVTGYILIFFKKTNSVKWFSRYLIGYTLLDILVFLGEVAVSDWALLSLPLQYIASIVFTYCYLQFAYHFKENNFEKEHRRVTLFVNYLTVPAILYTIYMMYDIGFGDYTMVQVLLPYPLFLICWSGAIFYRKYRVSQNEHSENELNASAYKAFFIITILAIFISIFPAMRALEVIGHALFTVTFFILYLTVFCMLTAAAVNYLTSRTTMLIKLVGISLVLFITIIGLQGFLIIPDYEFQTGQDISIENRREVHSQVLPYVWFLLGSSGVILSLFPIFFSRTVLLPLRRLLKGVDEVNKGNLSYRIGNQGYDELGVMSEHFDTMTSNLQIANVELQEYTEGLEEKVRERTEKLHQQTEELERLHKMRSKLFQDISHELRTPITLISGPIRQLLNSKKELDEHTHKQLQLSFRNSERLKKLVEQIIELNRLESEQLTFHSTKINISGHLQILCASYESYIAEQGLKLNTSIPKEAVYAELDEDKFEKIINNLISNAVKFTSKGGIIKVSLVSESEFFSIRVQDNGIGIPESEIPYIFDRFKSASKTNVDYKEGLGVGLAITKEYTELQNGSINVQSSPGNGSTFIVRFPTADAPITEKNAETFETIPKGITSDTENEKPITPEQPKTSSGTILLVEDNPDMADYIVSVLEENHYKVQYAANGKKGLQKLTNVKPDLIISDIMMPEMDGMTFLKKVREMTDFTDTPTIFLSALSGIDKQLEGLRLGVNDYLVKPFNPEELICRIQNLIEFRKVRDKFTVSVSQDINPDLDDELIQKLTKLVESKISNTQFNMEELSAEVAMSRSSMYREIKKITGLSAGAFVKEIRLQKARQRLENNSVKTLNEIAGAVGFSTPSYFTKLYKKRFGKHPSEYLDQTN
ncbi:MAG: response regulator [Balneola sp.]